MSRRGSGTSGVLDGLGRSHDPDDRDELDPALDLPAKPVRERMGYSAALVVVLLLAGLIGAGWWYAHRVTAGRIPHGTQVGGVDIGGQDPGQAAATLKSGLAAQVSRPITVAAGGRRIQVQPDAAGLSVDYAASVRGAVITDSWDPTQLWDYFTADAHLLPVVDVDQDQLRAEVTKLAQQLGQPTRDGAVRFDSGQLRVVAARDGQGLDVDAVSQALVKAFLAERPVADVALTSVPPKVTDHAVQVALDRYVNPALSAPVSLSFAGHPVTLRPLVYERALTLEPGQHGQLHLGVDQATLMQLVSSAADRAHGPVAASVALVGGSPRIVRGRPGISFTPQAVTRTFLSVLPRRDGARQASVPPVVKQAAFSTADARALKIRQTVATVTTHFSPRQVDTAALDTAVRRVNGTVLHPGQVFSLKQVAPPGGADESQLATTLYNAGFYAGLQDVAHTAPIPHVSRFPLGREATVSASGPDLRFKNDTRHGVLLEVTHTRRSLTATVWSTPTWVITASTSCARAAGSDVAEVTTSRTFKKPGSSDVDHVEKVVTNYPGLSARACAAAH